MSRAMRIGIVVAALAVAVIAFAALRPSDEDEESGPSQAPQVTDRRSQPAGRDRRPARALKITLLRPGAVKEIKVEKGKRVRFAVRSPRAEEAHVHGYDLIRRVPAGGRVRFDFPASLEGVFEIELERSEEQIGSLRVVP